jgi:hypothetical protein
MGSFFSSDRVLLASMHGKETAIAPVLEQRLGWRIAVVPDLDTDQFGTFSGEVVREGSALEAARKKAMAALNTTGATLALASEGSFGPHPALPFVASDHELLLLLDIANDFEIQASVLSVATNYAQKTVADWSALEQFAHSIGFPEHRLILKSREALVKGIGAWSDLSKHFSDLIRGEEGVWVETDMRAMYNPMRMKVIGQAAEALADKLLSLCPKCTAPGFEIAEAIPGLPCSLCNIPTTLAKAHRWTCRRCGFSLEKNRPDGLLMADAAHCDWCNP